jgi:hypothetical protein
MAVFWEVTPCSLIDIGRSNRDAYCFHHQGIGLEKKEEEKFSRCGA